MSENKKITLEDMLDNDYEFSKLYNQRQRELNEVGEMKIIRELSKDGLSLKNAPNNIKDDKLMVFKLVQL